MRLRDHVSATDPIVILTGAGISKESGLQTFRDPDGIWAKHRIEDVATPQAFARDPEAVLGFYNLRRAQMSDAEIKPNAAHAALGALEEFWPGGVLLVTQNIDDLHARGGSRNLIHMHGELAKTRCNDCGHLIDGIGDIETDMTCPSCGATERCGPMWSGSARCRSRWTPSARRSGSAACSCPSARRATSIRRPASSRKPASTGPTP